MSLWGRFSNSLFSASDTLEAIRGYHTVNNYSPLQALYRQMLCLFFPYALEYKIYSLKLYHIKHLHMKSKASAYMYRHLLQCLYANALDIRTCFRFYTQMQVEKNNKAFAYKIYSHFTQQCTYKFQNTYLIHGIGFTNLEMHSPFA